MKFGRPLDIPVLAMILLSARVWAFLFLDFMCRLIAPSFLRGEGGDTPPRGLHKMLRFPLLPLEFVYPLISCKTRHSVEFLCLYV